MTIEIKKGDISDFFASAKETAKEIDEGKKVTRKNTIWVESKDLMNLLKPERTKLVKYLRGKTLPELNPSPAGGILQWPMLKHRNWDRYTQMLLGLCGRGFVHPQKR